LQAFGPLGNGKELLADPLLVKIGAKSHATPAQVRSILYLSTVFYRDLVIITGKNAVKEKWFAHP
jgi:diketogulonate reductase-like aldo/keto reductase